MKHNDHNKLHRETQLTTLGRHPERHRGMVNPPIYRASTVLFPTLDAYEAAERSRYVYSTYGRYGTETTESLEEALAALDGVDKAIVTSCGLAAITMALLTFLSAGDHLLMTDSVYGPARKFCNDELKRFGIDITYYDPTVGAGIEALIRPNTKVVYLESPGSLTFEIQDVPAIAEIAHKHGCIVILDNTWATPFYFKPFEHGVDVAVYSATKYINGHSDLVMGYVTTTAKYYPELLRGYHNLGSNPGSDNCYLALRGLRTMAVRLRQHQESANILAKWLSARPEVIQVLHPSLEEHPQHDLWKRDFTGCTGLFSVLLKPYSREALAHMVDHMELFGMGYSWGGYESLLIPITPGRVRTAKPWTHDGIVLRVNVGLEHPDDLIAELDAALNRLHTV